MSYSDGDGLDLSNSNVFSIALASNPGLEFNSGDLRVKMVSGGGLSRGSGGLSIAGINNADNDHVLTKVKGGVTWKAIPSGWIWLYYRGYYR